MTTDTSPERNPQVSAKNPSLALRAAEECD
jgi:hypothetical protein